MIRQAVETDAEMIASIYNHYIHNTVVTFEETSVSARDMLQRMQRDEQLALPWMVAVDGNEVIGYTYATAWNLRSAYRYSVETTIYMSHECCGQGWGRRLYQALFNKLKERQVRVVIGGITLPNEASIRLHEKFAMQKVAHFTGVGYKFNKWLDVGYWQVNMK